MYNVVEIIAIIVIFLQFLSLLGVAIWHEASDRRERRRIEHPMTKNIKKKKEGCLYGKTLNECDFCGRCKFNDVGTRK